MTDDTTTTDREEAARAATQGEVLALLATLTAYQSLGSPEYLAALVEEHGAERVEVERLRKESDRLHEVALYYQGLYMREMARGRHPAEYPNDDKGPGMRSPARSGCDAGAAHDNAERLREEGL